jgi:hypothetical protein
LEPRESSVPHLAWVAAAAALLAAFALLAGIVTPPRAGPNCQAQCLSYPNADAVAYVPGDFLWMYPAFGMGLLFVTLIAGLHQRASSATKATTMYAACFAAMAGTLLAADYFVQLVIVQANLVSGDAASVAPLSMYNSRGMSARAPLERIVAGCFWATVRCQCSH